MSFFPRDPIIFRHKDEMEISLLKNEFRFFPLCKKLNRAGCNLRL